MILIPKILWIDLKKCLVNNEASFYLQSKVYFAKEFLMQDYPPELNISKFNPTEDVGEETEEGETKEEEKESKDGKKNGK